MQIVPLFAIGVRLGLRTNATDQPFGQNLPNVYIGANLAHNNNYFAGDIDDIRIYNRGLSAGEVQRLYLEGTGLSKSVDFQFSPVVSGRTYVPLVCTDLVSGVWQQLTGYTGPVTNGDQVTITDTNAVESRKFYRIKITYP